jgi:hypothetical protein
VPVVPLDGDLPEAVTLPLTPPSKEKTVLLQHTLDSVQNAFALAATPTPTVSPTGDTPAGGGDLNTAALITWAVKNILPILFLMIGIWIVSRSRLGRMSEVATTGGISIIGVMFIAGGPLLFIFGDKLVNMAIG